MSVSCKICSSDSVFLFQKRLLNKHEVSYFQCPRCDFVQVEEPYWLEEAYQSAINIYDTGIIQRNIHNASITALLLKLFFPKPISLCDYAGGYGFFVRLMRDWDFPFLWTDAYAQNLFARGFEWNKKDQIDFFSCFECFEHFQSPLDEIRKITDNGRTTLFCTTELLPRSEDLSTWWYLGLEHGQHISFYSRKTLSVIAEKLEMNLHSVGPYHLFTRKMIRPSNFWFVVKFYPRILAMLFFYKKKGFQKDYLELISRS